MAEPSPRWVLYHRAPEGDVPVVDFTRQGDEWQIAVHETPLKSALEERLLPTIGLHELQRAVGPHEGDLYLKALRQTFANSSRWFVVPADAGSA
jgi:hypothetical protein